MASALWPMIWFYGVSASCGMLIVRTWRSPQPRSSGWIGISGIVLAITWGLNFISMAWAALLGGIAWFLLIVLPSLGLRQVQSLISRQQYQRAYQWTMFLRYLHPFDGWWEQPSMLQALLLSQQGQRSAGIALLEKYQHSPSILARQAIAMHYTMAFDWAGLLSWRQSYQQNKFEPFLLVYYCRALGETGRLSELLHTTIQSKTKTQLLQSRDRRNWNLVLLFTAAFCGEVKAVQQLLRAGLASYPQEIRTFWLAIAHYGAGEMNQGQILLQSLQQVPTQSFRKALQVRLRRPPKPARLCLPPEAYPDLARLSRLIQRETQEASYRSLVDNAFTKAQIFSVNGLLVGINCCVFLGAIAASSPQNPEAFIQGGGLTPTLVLQGDWWRLLTANFIHAGPAHLLMNMITLALLGAFAEKHLGYRRYLVVYLGSGLGAMICLFGLVLLAQGFNYEAFPGWLTYLTTEIRYNYQTWVGASASIMGMIGAIAVVLWQGWRQLQLVEAKRQLRIVCLIIAIQFAVDLTSPNVSFYSHLLGLGWGIMLTFCLGFPKRPSPIGETGR